MYQPPCIDAHQHLWRYTPRAFPWISNAMPVLQRDHLLPDLQAVTASAGVIGTVAVQAQQNVEETNWLLDIADRSSLIRGVVGWVPLIDERLGEHLDWVAARTKLKGVRHILQDEADAEYMLRDDFNRGVSELHNYGLRYDILVFARQLPQTIAFVDRHPHQVFILDHMAKPPIRDGRMQPWEGHLRELARRPNVYCKVSGLVSEADRQHWIEADVRRYTDVALSCFGPERLMFGSDWPVLQVASTYQRWHGTVMNMIAGLTLDEQARILAGTATEVYGLQTAAGRDFGHQRRYMF